MTCRCRAEFCYLCSIPWKNCKCSQWDEARLLEEARVRTARYLKKLYTDLKLKLYQYISAFFLND
jgi:hypothetical protein